MKTRQKKSVFRIIILLAVVMAVTSVTVFFAMSNGESGEAGSEYEDFVVFTVDSEPITFREYFNSVLHVRGDVISYFITNGADTAHPDFWHTPINGVTPLEELRNRATARAARIKIIQIYAREAGLVNDICYESFLRGLYDENQRREEVVADGGIIFGPQHYSERLFFDIRTADLEEAVRQSLSTFLTTPYDELYQFYLNEWQETPSVSGWLFVEQLSAPFMPDGYLFSHEALALLESVLDEAQQGADLLELANTSNYLHFEGRFLGLRRGEGNIRTRAAIQTGWDMQVGEVSEIFQDLNSWAIILMVDRNEEAFLDFDDLWVVMQRTMAERNFIEYIDGLVEAAEIEINQDAAEIVDELLSRSGE